MIMIAIIAMFFACVANAQTQPNTQQAVQSVIIMDNIKSFEEAIKPMRGKKIYIDFWGSWCKPCLMEFAHNDALKKILAENDIQQLYISFDPDRYDKQWKDCIKQYNLIGTHIRAQREFSSELTNLFFTYEGKIQIGLPHYVLIDEKGNIINKSAKRPSQLVAGEKLW